MENFPSEIKDLLHLKDKLENSYRDFKNLNLNLDMSRGKTSPKQLDLSLDLLNQLKKDNLNINGVDCRNYGVLDGISGIKNLFAKILDVDPLNVFVGGNSSLCLMFDTIDQYMYQGVNGNIPWSKQGKIKFLCPCPGYDRHFAMLDYFGIEQICIPMTSTGPDMDLIEKLLSTDEKIKGIFCVPKYSNPQGITYSDETVTRFAKLKPKATDFRIFWDNAYAVHDIRQNCDKLLSIMQECKKYSNEDIFVMFSSTSKITFPGAGISVIAASTNNLNYLKEKYSKKTIGFNKLNQLAHLYFLKDYENLLSHMQKHRKILEPKFDMVLKHLNENFKDNNLVKWTSPNGGYFISVDLQLASAKKVVDLCKKAGLKLTPAGSTYPKGQDTRDNNIRIAPTYPSLEELDKAMDLFCLCVKLSSIEKLLTDPS